jgi:hypothetical protein
MDAWSIKGGIPHIRMGDGKFIPVDSSTFTNIAANMIPTYAVPEGDVNTNVARQELAGRVGGPDLSKMKLPPPPPPPKGSKVLDPTSKEGKEAAKAFKKAGNTEPPQYGGYTVSVDNQGKKWYQKITGIGTNVQGAKVIKIAVTSYDGKVTTVGEIPYQSNGDGNIAMTGPDGRAFMSFQGELARGLAAIGQDIIQGSYDVKTGEQILRDPQAVADYGWYTISKEKQDKYFAERQNRIEKNVKDAGVEAKSVRETTGEGPSFKDYA